MTDDIMKFSASDAREMAGPTPEELLKGTLLEIKEAARQGKRKLALRNEPWVHGGYKGSADYFWCKAELEARGFKVEYVYEERQFVDMYTKVSWSL